MSLILSAAVMLSFSITAYAAEFTGKNENAGAQQSIQLPEIRQFGLPEAEETEVAEVKAVKVKPTGAWLTWESETVCLSYTVCRYNEADANWEPVAVTSATAVYIGSLKENTAYRFAVTDGCSGKMLGTVDFKTGIRAPKAKAVRVASDSVELSVINAGENNAAEIFRSTDGKSYKKIGETENGSFTDTKVKEATDYYYTVKPLNKTPKVKSAVTHVTTMKSFALPADTNGECKTYAYYTAVTAKSSPQYKLLRSSGCYTDEETGIRMVDGFYCVALGSFYGKTIGTKYRITLRDGKKLKKINVILCDQKADRHTNSTHQYAMRNKDVVEFYVEKAKIPRGIRGDYGTLEKFSGDIVKIEQYVEE